MPNGFQLRTERLLLRHLAPTDLDALHAVLGDEETMRYPYSKARC